MRPITPAGNHRLADDPQARGDNEVAAVCLVVRFVDLRVGAAQSARTHGERRGSAEKSAHGGPPRRRTDRASLALDLMEAVRPLVDSYVLTLAPRLLAERGCGVLIAAKLVGEIAGVTRSRSATVRRSAFAPSPHERSPGLDRPAARRGRCVRRSAFARGGGQSRPTAGWRPTD
jgi:hypothetical protein